MFQTIEHACWRAALLWISASRRITYIVYYRIMDYSFVRENAALPYQGPPKKKFPRAIIGTAVAVVVVTIGVGVFLLSASSAAPQNSQLLSKVLENPSCALSAVFSACSRANRSLLRQVPTSAVQDPTTPTATAGIPATFVSAISNSGTATAKKVSVRFEYAKDLSNPLGRPC